jgi:hypothetical protein
MVNSTLQGLLGTFGIKNTQFDFILNKKKNLRPFLALQQTQWKKDFPLFLYLSQVKVGGKTSDLHAKWGA